MPWSRAKNQMKWQPGVVYITSNLHLVICRMKSQSLDIHKAVEKWRIIP
jgi:hypothetical protein